MSTATEETGRKRVLVYSEANNRILYWPEHDRSDASKWILPIHLFAFRWVPIRGFVPFEIPFHPLSRILIGKRSLAHGLPRKM
jgi:hypothetical protein